jgi:transcriptional regulator with XRE-family HTH domain
MTLDVPTIPQEVIMPTDSRKLTREDPRRLEAGLRLRAAREATGLSQSAVANRLGVNRTYVSGLESGHRIESWPLMVAMVAELGYDPRIVAPEFFPRENLKAPTPPQPATSEDVPAPESGAGKKIRKSGKRGVAN